MNIRKFEKVLMRRYYVYVTIQCQEKTKIKNKNNIIIIQKKCEQR